MENIKDCPICDAKASCYPNYDMDLVFYVCPTCGRFELNRFYNKVNQNHLASFLVYNGFKKDKEKTEHRYHTMCSKEICDQYRKEYDSGNIIHGRPVHFDADIIENWYPKTFSEKIDRILLFLNSQIRHMGQEVSFDYQTLLSAFFIDRKEHSYDMVGNDKWSARDPEELEQELQYMLDYLVECSYIKNTDGVNEENWTEISLLPAGYERIDVLQKNTTYGRNALVAMKFGDDTKPLREAIRKGIKDAGYVAIFIDEVQHNDFITPELLKHIKDSKFVVVDLTHQNNGAYFEEGYAMGLGKPVIQLCQQDTRLHFDIAQKNTIMWDVEDNIPEKLTNRIKATID